jgi:hypothetical protein
MESLPRPASSVVAVKQRTSIPLRSILNVEEGCDSAAKVESRTSLSANEAFTAHKPVVQRSRFLFVNAHNSSRPQARLRQDQKVINAHVQHTSHRKRRAAAIDRLKQTHHLCAPCSQSGIHGSVIAPERSSSPSSSASESSPISATATKGTTPRWPLPKGSDDIHVCDQCGTSLPTTEGSHTAYGGRKKAARTVSTITTALAAAKEKTPSLTLFVEDQPTSFLDTGMMDPFATGSVSMNMEMNGVLLHCKSSSVMYLCPLRACL